MQRQKSSQIVIGDPNHAHAVRHEIARLDPPPDRTGGDSKTFCDLGDRVEIHRVALMPAPVAAA